MARIPSITPKEITTEDLPSLDVNTRRRIAQDNYESSSQFPVKPIEFHPRVRVEGAPLDRSSVDRLYRNKTKHGIANF